MAIVSEAPLEGDSYGVVSRFPNCPNWQCGARDAVSLASAVRPSSVSRAVALKRETKLDEDRPLAREIQRSS